MVVFNHPNNTVARSPHIQRYDMARPKRDLTRMNFYVQDGIVKGLKVLADKRGTTSSEIVRAALREYVLRELQNEKDNNTGAGTGVGTPVTGLDIESTGGDVEHVQLELFGTTDD
jgi:hypothetical protein|tara:strand:+ start:349 stop:693 length:345 start_codon:yes stop_codon:yes gene_type:complete